MAIRDGLTDYGTPEQTAEAWCHAWEAEAHTLQLDRSSSEYWTLGSAWIHEPRARRKDPT